MLEDVEVAHDLSAVLRDAEATGEPLTRGPQALAGALWQNQVDVATPVAAPAGVAMSAGAAAASAGGSTGSASNFLSRQPPDPTPPPPPRRVIRIGQR
jgi:uncharacterized heparinase superfamily protein